MTFIRRFAAMPSVAILLAVSGVVIVDTPPPRPAQAAAFGAIAIVGEFEDGPFNTPTQLLQANDWPTIFGGLGYTYGGLKNRYACAKRSGGSEDWNGNAYLQSTRLRFAGVTIVRVDASIGAVVLTPRAHLQGTVKAPFNIAPGQTFIFTPNGGGPVTATFAGTAAAVTGAGGTFTSFAGGEVLPIGLDGNSSIDVTFQPGDTSLAAIITRINTVLGAMVASNASGQLKITSTRFGTGSRVVIGASAAATTLGLAVGTQIGTGDAVDLAATTLAEVKAKVEAASAAVAVSQGSAGFPRLASKTGGSGTIAIGAGTANAALGFTTGQSATAALAADVSIPAGTRVTAGTDASRVVTMQTTTALKGSTDAVTLRVRPAVDDGSYAGQAIGTLTTLEDRPADGEWSVTNLAAVSAALTAAQLDALYLTAIDATVGIGNDVTRTLSGIVSARTSAAIRARVRQNAIDTSAGGHQGRRAFVCPPNGTTAAVGLGASAPGVGPYRAEQLSYEIGGVRCFVQELIDGGYSTTGVYIRHPDVMMAARWSRLPPGYNPGQFPEDPVDQWDKATFLGLEPVAQGWDLTTYAAFKAAGINAVEYDKDTGIGFAEGLTSVDPATDPARTTIARKTLADFIADSCAALAKFQVKRQGTTSRREQQRMAYQGFLNTLVGDVVDTYALTLTTSGLPTGVIRWDFAVNPIQSDDVIVFNLSVGPGAVELARS